MDRYRGNMRTTLPALGNVVSVVGASVCVVAGIMAAQQASLSLVAWVFLTGSLCDLADGQIARAVFTEHPSKPWGAFLDSLADKIGELGLLFGLAFRFANPSIVRILMVAACTGLLCSFIKSAAGEKGIKLNWPEVRILGRTMRVVILTAGLLLVFQPEERSVWLLAVVLVVWNISMIIARVFRIYKEHLKMMNSDQ